MRRSFDEMFEGYTEEDGNPWGINWRSSQYKRMNDVIDILHPILKKRNLRVLEAGCATGDMTELILRCIKNLEVYDAFDVSRKAISICKERKLDSRCRWFVSNLADLQLDEMYDLIICCDVIYYLSFYQQKQCMDIFYDHLSQGGHLFLCVPYEKREIDRLVRLRGKFIVERKSMGYGWLWYKIEAAVLRLYNQANGTWVKKVLRKVITNHTLMECFVWVNRKAFPNKYSHMYMFLRKK